MNRKNLSPVQMVWIGTEISPIEALCMNSFLAHHHEVHLYAYDEVKGVPQGVQLKDASRVFSRDAIFKHKGSYAAFADLFRWKLMVENGGIYVDTDVVCLQSFTFEDACVIGWEVENELLTPTVMSFQNPGHPLALDMLDIALHPLRIESFDRGKMRLRKLMSRIIPKPVHAMGWGYTAGPLGLTHVYKSNPDKYECTLKSPDCFYPIYFERWRDFVDPHRVDESSFAKNTYAVHLWNEMWRRNGVDKWGEFHKDSFIGKALEKYQ